MPLSLTDRKGLLPKRRNLACCYETATSCLVRPPRIGESVQIERAESTTIRLPGHQVAIIADSLVELYQKRSVGRHPSDLRRLHADIHWCLRYGLVREAAQDVLLARQFDPTNLQTVQLLKRGRRSASKRTIRIVESRTHQNG